jgi:hypothetical protein
MSWIRPALLLAGLSFVLPGCGSAAATATTQLRDSVFVARVHRLSEPGGYFDTDNLISNEDSYLHVLGGMRRIEVTGGAFIGVGPDQSFSYIAQVRPSIAFLMDVRRDNLIQHLWFKALFTLAETRLEYLSLMFGKALPEDPQAWVEASPEEVVAQLESGTVLEHDAGAIRGRVRETVQSFGMGLSDEDMEMLDFIHLSFIRGGVRLKFTSYGRAPNPYYPSYRDLLLSTDLTGRKGNYLAREDDYRFVRSLQLANLVVPVVGDLAGDHALKAIGDEVRAMGEVVTVFYTSNVEFYLFEDGTFERFARNVATLPRNPSSVVIRSVFRRKHAQSQPGFLSTQLLQRIDRLVGEWEAGNLRSYFELVTVGVEPPG